MRLILISADDPLQARQLAMAASRRHGGAVAIDLSGEALLPGPHAFDALAALEQRWPPLLQQLGPWLELLQLGNLEAHQLPLLPGLDEVLRTLFLLDHLQAAPGPALVLLLPPPAQAQRFLLGLVGAPELLNQLYEPLVGRLGQLKESLSHLDALLNLRLPDSSGLRLPQSLRQQLEQLRELLLDSDHCELLLALGASQGEGQLLSQRICGFYLCGVQLSRLWLNGPIEPGALEQLQQQWQPAQLLHTSQIAALSGAGEAWLNLPWAAEVSLICRSDPDDTVVFSVLLPGLSKDQLQVQRVGTALQVRVGPLRRSYPLPEACLRLSPSGARVAGRRLEVRFR